MAGTGVDYAKLGSGAAAVRLTRSNCSSGWPRSYRRRGSIAIATAACWPPVRLLRQAVTAMASAPRPPAATPNPPPAQSPLRRAARRAWAQLLARTYEVFPLLCPPCATRTRIVAFITEPGTLRAIIVHLK